LNFQRAPKSIPPPPPFPLYQIPPVSYGMVPLVPEPFPRDHYRNSNWDPRPMVGDFVLGMNKYRGSSHRGYFGVFFPILVYFSILISKMGRKKIIYQNGQILPVR